MFTIKVYLLPSTYNMYLTYQYNHIRIDLVPLSAT